MQKGGSACRHHARHTEARPLVNDELVVDPQTHPIERLLNFGFKSPCLGILRVNKAVPTHAEARGVGEAGSNAGGNHAKCVFVNHLRLLFISSSKIDALKISGTNAADSCLRHEKKVLASLGYCCNCHRVDWRLPA